MKLKQKQLFEILIIVIGNILYAITVVLFLEPSGLITGGATGVALFVNRLTDLSTSWVLFGINLLMFVLGWIFLGRKFAAETALSTFIIPIAIQITEFVVGDFVLTNDILLCTLFGGLGIGVSVGMVIRVGASTGGLDILPLLLNKYCRVSVALGMWAFDIAVLLMQVFFSDRNAVLYGIIMTVVYSVILDQVMTFGNHRVEIKIVSKKAPELAELIRTRVDRGMTFLEGKTGYLQKPTEVILSVVSVREFAKIERLVLETDPEAFLISSRVSGVSGRGFTEEKKYL